MLEKEGIHCNLTLLFGLAGARTHFSAHDAVSANGLLLAEPVYYTTGAWGSNLWAVDIAPRYLPLVAREVYLGKDGDPPAVSWTGPLSLEVNGKSVAVFGGSVQDFPGD